MKGDGSPADYSCAHSPYDPLSLGSSLSVSLHSSAFLGTGAEDLPGAIVSAYDVATGEISPDFVVTGEDARGTLVLPDATRMSFRVTHPPQGEQSWIETYVVDRLTPSVGFPRDVEVLGVSSAVYDLFLALTGFEPSDLAGRTQLGAEVRDCDGDRIENAFVAGLPRCTDGDELPCVVYMRGGFPSLDASGTDASGLFAIGGIEPGVLRTIEVQGVVTSGGQMELVGVLNLRGTPGTIAFGEARPPTE